MHEEPSAANNRILRKAKRAKQEPLSVGDTVLVREYGQQGTIVRVLKDGKFEVQLGILKMILADDEVEKQQSAPVKETKQTNKRSKKSHINTNKAISRAEASATLDLRGVRYEPAMAEVDRFIDKALLNNLSSVEIIHGKGTGAIRKGVQEYLRSNSQVQSFKFTGPDQGATYVQLK
jgi:DNA mismatch repair protein MutS2